MIKFNKKALALLGSATILSVSVASSTYAATQGKKMLEAWYKNIKISYNNQVVSVENEPFIVKGTTYVSASALAKILNKNVGWNASTNTVLITDKPDPVVDDLKAQLEGKNFQISELQAKVKKLEEEQDNNTSTDLSDLEDDLNDEYGKYKGIKFSIDLSGDEDDIEVKIQANLYTYKSEWNDLTKTNKTDYLQDICDDVLKEYKNADITGYIKDTDKSSKVLTFTTSSSGTVRLDDSVSQKDLDDLEEEIEDDYYDYLSGITFSSITLSGDEDDISFKVNLDADRYKSKWQELSDSSLISFLTKIYNDIEDEYGGADITGKIYDTYNGKTLIEFERYNGSFRLYRK